MRRVSWSRASLNDLDRIDAWLMQEASPEIAIRILLAIRERANFLLDFPRGGPALDEDVRSLRIPRTAFRFLYRVEEDAIQILRVRHGREDWAEDE